MLAAWKTYWFKPAPCLDLAVVRVFAVAIQLFWLRPGGSFITDLELRAALPDAYWHPITILNLLNVPFGWGFRPDFELIHGLYLLALAAGLLALVGLLTNLTLAVLATTSVYLHAFNFSLGDYHHPEAVMMVALTVLALSPSGRVLSLDALLRRRPDDWVEAESAFAGWPLRLLQWFFVLMYLSAVWSKLTHGGLDWSNGYTLQYYLARDGLRWDSPLAIWLAHHHELVRFGQVGVLLFQSTFWLAVIWPRLRWIYVPAGLGLHVMIYLTLTANFFQWMALYSVFIPWREALRRLRAFRAGRTPVGAPVPS